MTSIKEGTILWQPTEEFMARSALRHYMAWLERTRGLSFKTYDDLWQWSVTDLEGFWQSIWDYFQIQSSQPPTAVLASRDMPGAVWFPGGRLNYAQHIFRNASASRPALLFQSERQPLTAISWDTLTREVAAVAQGLAEMGVQAGDRVVAYLPNIPETIVAFLAASSLGATWSSCSPDFGSGSVIDRFQQIEPKVLFACDGYQYGGKAFDRRSTVAEIQAALPTLQHTVLVSYLHGDEADARALYAVPWQSWLHSYATHAGPAPIIDFAQLPFDHPLYVLYSSGTTGLPKPIVHGQGGVLLEHMKAIHLHANIQAGDKFFWYTSTGWMMWNFIVSGLLVGASVLVYDGSPGYPDLNVLWQYAQDTGMTLFGTSAAYILSCLKAEIEPGKDFDLSRLVAMGSTGSPLPPEGFQWVYDHVKPDLWLGSLSGGTDVCTAFLMNNPLLPVRAGQIQCRALGCKVEAFDEDGRPLVDQVGELVITEPMPSMPIAFWNDPDRQRYTESYFAMYPGIWRHGDWIKITPEGMSVIYGRSDSTLNRMGVRMGTSELYSAVEGIPEIVDALVIDLTVMGREPYMPLFVVLKPGVTLDDDLKTRIRDRIRATLSPRHVPDDIFAIREVPRTLNGKKMEVPIKKILLGMPIAKAANPDSMSNPASLQVFVDLSEQIKSKVTPQ